MTCANEIHPLKALFAIEITEDGIMISVNEVQFSNAQFSIDLTVTGILI